jgi:predicted TIM-barrel enzyme
MEKRAMYSRQHTPLLLQTTSTSPLESYNAVLKRKGDATFGLIGTCRTVSAVNQGLLQPKLDESGFDVYISRMRVAVERELDDRDIEAEGQRWNSTPR